MLQHCLFCCIKYYLFGYFLSNRCVSELCQKVHNSHWYSRVWIWSAKGRETHGKQTWGWCLCICEYPLDFYVLKWINSIYKSFFYTKSYRFYNKKKIYTCICKYVNTVWSWCIILLYYIYINMTLWQFDVMLTLLFPGPVHWGSPLG